MGGENLQVIRRNNLRQKHHPKTGEWVFKREEMVNWREINSTGVSSDATTKHLLWLHGKRKVPTHTQVLSY
jgi:hypothetical protein